MMKEYTYEIEHSLEKQRRPVAIGHQQRLLHHHHHHHTHHHNHQQQVYRQRSSGDDADASSISGKYSILSLDIYLKVNE